MEVSFEEFPTRIYILNALDKMSFSSFFYSVLVYNISMVRAA